MANIVEKKINEQDQPIFLRWDDGFWSMFDYDVNGNQTYYENSDGDVCKRQLSHEGEASYLISPTSQDTVREQLDNAGNILYVECADGYWENSEYDNHGNRTSWKDSDGAWLVAEFDSLGNETFYKDSDGEERGLSRKKTDIPARDESEKFPSVDDLISRATAISEQTRGLADDLSRFRDGFEIDS